MFLRARANLGSVRCMATALLSTLWHARDEAIRSAVLADLGVFFAFITHAQGVSKAYEVAHAGTAQNGLDVQTINAVALPLPADALELARRILSMHHPCFRFASQREVSDDETFGLNLAASRAAEQIVGLVDKGSSARAGLHEGDTVKLGKPYTEGKGRVLEVVMLKTEKRVVLTSQPATMVVPAVFGNATADPKRCRRETP
jgi:GTPase